MDEFDQILPSNFPDPTDPDPTPNLANIDGDADATEDEGDYLPEQHAGRDNGDDPMGSGSRSKGKGVMSSMSEREKKDRQKEQNRKAAERSRAKKRQEQSGLEVSIQSVHAENEQLRKRLTTLRAGQPNASSPSTTEPALGPTQTIPTQAGTGIDYAYLNKLTTELSTSKANLLEKQLELARMKGDTSNPELEGLRQLLLTQNTKLISLKAEANSLESTISHLRSERDELVKQWAVVTCEVDMRKALKGTKVGDWSR